MMRARAPVAVALGLALAACAGSARRVELSPDCDYALHHVDESGSEDGFTASLGGESVRLVEPPYLGPGQILRVRDYGVDRPSGRELLLVELSPEAARLNAGVARARQGHRIGLTCNRRPLAVARLLGTPQRRFLVARPAR